MVKTTTEQISTYIITSIQCDCCKKDYEDNMDWQEFVRINDVGGYNSAIGDCVHYECDLCSECVNRLLGKYLRIIEETG